MNMTCIKVNGTELNVNKLTSTKLDVIRNMIIFEALRSWKCAFLINRRSITWSSDNEYVVLSICVKMLRRRPFLHDTSNTEVLLHSQESGHAEAGVPNSSRDRVIILTTSVAGVCRMLQNTAINGDMRLTIVRCGIRDKTVFLLANIEQPSICVQLLENAIWGGKMWPFITLIIYI